MNYHKNSKKGRWKKESGITLIALIITIIILVILAAVTIRAAFNSGIIDYSVNGTQNYIEGQSREREHLIGWKNFLESTLDKLNKVSKHPEQTLTDDVGIDAQGNVMNLDLWNYYTSGDDYIIVEGGCSSGFPYSRVHASDSRRRWH